MKNMTATEIQMKNNAWTKNFLPKQMGLITDHINTLFRKLLTRTLAIEAIKAQFYF